MSEHTPGPYRWEEEYKRSTLRVFHDWQRGGCGETLARGIKRVPDAKLFASAPDLLAENRRLQALNSDLLAALKETGHHNRPCQVTGHFDERCSKMPISERCLTCFVRAAIKAAEKQSAGEQS